MSHPSVLASDAGVSVDPVDGWKPPSRKATVNPEKTFLDGLPCRPSSIVYFAMDGEDHRLSIENLIPSHNNVIVVHPRNTGPPDVSRITTITPDRLKSLRIPYFSVGIFYFPDDESARKKVASLDDLVACLVRLHGVDSRHDLAWGKTLYQVHSRKAIMPGNHVRGRN